MNSDMSDRITNKLCNILKTTAAQRMDDSGSLAFLGHKYEVRVVNEGTDREQLLIFKRQQNVGGEWSRVWTKPMSIGG